MKAFVWSRRPGDKCLTFDLARDSAGEQLFAATDSIVPV